MKRNPTDNIEKPKLPKSLPRFLTKDEMKNILSTIDWISWRTNFERNRNKAIIATFLFTGIRHQELLNLRNDDVDISGGNIFVKNGKGSKDRLIPIQNQLLPILKSYVQSKKAFKNPSVWFFHSSKSEKQLGQKDIRAMCKKISKSSKVYFTPHMLRHTFGRLSVENNINIFGIQQIMGHSDIKTTQRYLSVSLKALKDEYAKVEFL
ncbi:MAG: tyrosine-type recombinase/integrase [Chloroflexia bacterium]|nr:tyrosine-type recombinase/integrase [Chloroflexia bacterium]